MNELLASVRSLHEAKIAFSGGANIIDLKEPEAGALGAVEHQVLEQVVEYIDRRVQVSATIGDLDNDPDTIYHAIMRTHGAGVDLVKVGLFPSLPAGQILDTMQRAAAQGVALIAVLFADSRLDMGLLCEIKQAGLRGAMLDTAAKAKGSLLEHQSLSTLGIFSRRCAELDLICGLAGSLRLADISTLLPLQADYLGFRTALCKQAQRVAEIDSAALAEIRRSLSSPQGLVMVGT